MSFLRDIWGDLVEKRLWPVAVAMVVALVAAPVLLAGGSGDDGAAAPVPAPAAPATGAPATAGSTAGGGTVVSLADKGAAPSRATGTYRDPFAGAAGARAKTQAEGKSTGSSSGSATARAAAAAAAAAAQASGSGSSGGSGESSGVSGAASSATAGSPDTSVTTVAKTNPPPTASPAPTVSRALAPRENAGMRIDVTWGPAGSAKRLKDLIRLGRLSTNGQTPVALLFGTRADRKTAVFLLLKDVTAVGDGRCLPSARDCQLLHLKAGESEFLDVPTGTGDVVQYELDVDRVARRYAGTEAAARRLRHRESKFGRKLMFEAVGDGRSASTEFMYKSRFGVLVRDVPGR